MKKLLSILLSVLICLSAMSGISVFAEETDPSTQPETNPTTTEQITTSSKPTSTIPGGTGITYNLTNVISSNMQEEAWNDYETTLSPVSGYKINYISIKYGEEEMDVTNNGDGTYTFKHEGGFSYPLSITAGAQLITDENTSQEYSTTTEPESNPTTTEQITTSTTPKSTIPGGAYVTYNLTNVISSNMQEEVWGYYETTFSPEPGYKINYIFVKQGDKDMPVIDNGDGTYTFKHEGGFTDNLTITVKAKPFPTKLSATDLELCVSTSSVIDVIDGTAISWKSSNEQVATVDNGKVLGVGVGTATITVTLSSYDYLTCHVKVLDYAEQPLPSTTQEFCDAVNKYITDSGLEEMYFLNTDESGNKIMLSPENIKSNGAIKIYLETTNFAIFNINGVLSAFSEENLEGYTFSHNTTFTDENPCGYCVYKNNKIYSLKDAINKGMTDILTLACVIPGTTKDGAPVTVNKNQYVKVNPWGTNKTTACKIGSRYVTTIKLEPYKGQEFVINDVIVIMNKDTFVTPIRVNENTAVIDIPYVTGEIKIAVDSKNKTYPTVGEILGCFATNMENVSFYICYSGSDNAILLEDQIFDCACGPYYYKIVPDEGYEIVSVTRKIRLQNYETGEYK
ncbi:MAG: Ig-like domain-containing protein, partial [Ruminococcus sp.]